MPKVKKVRGAKGADARGVTDVASPTGKGHRRGDQGGHSASRGRSARPARRGGTGSGGGRSPARSTKGGVTPTRARRTGARARPAAAARTSVPTATPATGRRPKNTAPPAATARVDVRALDPVRKCGANTSVQRLYRVEERVGARAVRHLVFLDRHGWYCEHGRACPAVGHARKYNGQIARAS